MDFEATKQAIVSASKLPMSIIIIGVGKYSFKDMRALDNDKKLLTAGGVNATRDIVQFVRLYKYVNHEQGTYKKQDLAEEVLKELPRQITKWKKLYNKK